MLTPMAPPFSEIERQAIRRLCRAFGTLVVVRDNEQLPVAAKGHQGRREAPRDTTEPTKGPLVPKRRPWRSY